MSDEETFYKVRSTGLASRRPETLFVCNETQQSSRAQVPGERTILLILGSSFHIATSTTLGDRINHKDTTTLG